MSKRIVVDPVTRIEGHLRVEVEVENGKVVDAWTKGTMFRGIEQIVQGRDPRDAIYIVERICGVCMATHGLTSALAVEDASNSNIPPAARLMRNLLVGAIWLHDHILHFYHLSALDYLDVLAVKNYSGKDQNLIKLKEKIINLVQAQDVSPLMPRYKPDDYSVTNSDIVTTTLAHYLEALHMQAQAKKMSAIIGGKQPHQSSIVAGGVTICPTEEQLFQFKEILDEVVNFVNNVYIPDALFFTTEHLLPLAKNGFGEGTGNYLSYGGFELAGSRTKNLFESGFVNSKNQNDVLELDLNKITESVASAWYQKVNPATPWESETVVDFDRTDAYTFVKSPRYHGLSTEVGSLARMMVSKHKPFINLLNKHSMKQGVVARHLARALETAMMTEAMYGWLQDLEKQIKGKRIHDTNSWEPPMTGMGVGLTEAPRGALGHWIEIANQKVKNYQIVVPTTWNVSPRDDKGVPGPIEQALIGTPVDVDNPVNLMRVIRSFNPCMACAVHVTSVDGERMVQL